MMTSNNSTEVFPGARIRRDTIPALVMMVFILLINGGVIFLISCHSRLRTKSNIILISLAVSDFLVGFVGIPLVVACSATFYFPLCLSSSIFCTFISFSTVLHITAMTCDRYIYITWALRYDEIVQRGRAILVVAFIWFISLYSLVRLSWTLNINMHTAKEDLALVQEKETIYLMFNFIVFFFIPLVTMAILDAHMLLLLREQCYRIARDNLPAELVKREKKMQRRQRRAVLTCVLLLILYVILWLPYFILELMQHYFGDRYGVPYIVSTTITYLRLCTPIFNPLIYTLRKYDLKRAAERAWYNAFSSCRHGLPRKRPEEIPLSSGTNV